MILKCSACAAKDVHIASLERRLDSLERAYLALADLKAHNARYRDAPRAQPAEDVSELPPMVTTTTPAMLREQVFTPTMNAATVEKWFAQNPDEGGSTS